MIWEQISRFLVYHCKLYSCEASEAKDTAEQAALQLLQNGSACALWVAPPGFAGPGLYEPSPAQASLPLLVFHSFCQTKSTVSSCFISSSPLQGSTGTQNSWLVSWPAAAHFAGAQFSRAWEMAVHLEELLLMGAKHPECSPGPWLAWDLRAGFLCTPSALHYTDVPLPHNLCYSKGQGSWEWTSSWSLGITAVGCSRFHSE